MSFLKFTGKKGSKKSEDLDLPPLPPPIKSPEAEKVSIDQGPPLDAELPDLDIGGSEPSMPESSEMSSLEFPDSPPMPESPEVGNVPKEDEAEESDMMKPMETQEESEQPPAETTEVKPQEGPIYIKIDKYGEVLKEINKIKADFEKSENVLSSMVEIKASEDKELESWKRSLEDIKNKLSFIDSTVFEGG